MTGRVFTSTIPVRWGDSDRLGHVNNVQFAEYAQEARVQFLMSLRTDAELEAARTGTSLGPTGASVMRTLDIEFLLPITDASGPIEVDTAVTRVGTSSVALAQEFRDVAGRVCARTRSVMVGFEPATETSRPWTDVERRMFSSYVPATA